MTEDLRQVVARMAREASEATDASAPEGDFRDASARARAALARALAAADDDTTALELLEAWRQVTTGVVGWDETEPRQPLAPIRTLPEAPRSQPHRWRRWLGLHYPVRSLARRVGRRLAAVVRIRS